jgi:hypothetical protein
MNTLGTKIGLQVAAESHLVGFVWKNFSINPLHAQLNPICHLLALLGAHHILHVSR